MNRYIRLAAVAFALTFLGYAGLAPTPACADAPKKEKFDLIHVADLKRLMGDQTLKVAVFDANTEGVRKKDGVIPGAKLLSSFNEYDIAKELPSDKSTELVFYCANPRCSASHEAAERAFDNGYARVHVMTDGIQGWKKAGEKTDQPLS